MRILKASMPLFFAALLFSTTLQPVFAQVSGQWRSLNWAGYVAEGGGYTHVTGTWTVPAVTPAATSQGDAQWVGIGGMGSSDLIQAGTQAYVHDNTVDYFAWFELLPQYSTAVPLNVRPGDSVTATITEGATDAWTIVITNNTTGERYSQDVTYHSQHLSAEWVEEMVSNTDGTFRPVDQFGTVLFSQGFTTQQGALKSIADTETRVFTMHDRNGDTLAAPTDLTADGAGFSVTRQGGEVASGFVNTAFVPAPPETVPVQPSAPQPTVQELQPITYTIPDPFAPKEPDAAIPNPYGGWSWPSATSTVSVTITTAPQNEPTTVETPAPKKPVASVVLKHLTIKKVRKVAHLRHIRLSLARFH